MNIFNRGANSVGQRLIGQRIIGAVDSTQELQREYEKLREAFDMIQPSITHQQAVKAQQAMQAGYGQATTGPSIDWSSEALMRMVAMRLRTREGERMPFDFMNAYKNKESVVVFFVHDGHPNFVEDDWGMFPSDALITKLRLIVG